MFLLLPLTCVYYPVAVLPRWLQCGRLALPPTYVFEGMRALLIEHVFRADLMWRALALECPLVRRPECSASCCCSTQRGAMEPCCRRGE